MKRFVLCLHVRHSSAHLACFYAACNTLIIFPALAFVLDMPVCSSDWTWNAPAFPGSACREFDFSLLFSTLVLSIIPSTCFIILAGRHTHVLWHDDLKINKSRVSLLLCGAKMICASVAVLGSMIGLFGWVRVSEGRQASGTVAAALSVPSAVSESDEHQQS